MNRMGKATAIRRSMAIVLSICLMLSSFGVAFAADDVKDIKGHWAEKQLKAWIDKGYIQGYADGTVKPDNTITRAEFMTIVNRSFGFKDKAEVKAKDVDSKSWEYEQVAIALKAGYITGYEDGTIKPSGNVTRQEVAVMLASLLKLDTKKTVDLSKYKDASKLPDWSKAAFGAVVEKGIFNGYEDGTLGYDQNIKRAEAIVTLDRALGNSFAATYDKAGTYGPETGSQTIQGNVLVSVGGVTLKNLTITGSLTLGEGIGEGDVTLDNVTVQGDTNVNGGGANSIHFKDSVLVTIIVNKKTGEVRIVAEGKTTVKQVNVQSNAKIDNSKATNGGFSNVKLEDKLPEGSKVSLVGNFENVDISSKTVAVDVPNGTIKNLNASGGSSLTLGKDAKIVSLVLNAVLKVLGEGKIDKATINKGAEGTTFTNQPSSTTYGSGATGGGGGGGSSSSSGGSGNNNEVANIESATAVNGTITVKFTDAPPVTLSVGNFVVNVAINNGTATSVTPTAMTFDRGAKTATLTVPAIVQAANAQSVVYTVSYRSKTVSTPAFTVAAQTGVTVTGLTYNATATVTGATYTLQLALSATYSVGSPVDVTSAATGWTSADTSIVTVSGTGFLTGKANGSTVVTATYGGFTATYNVTVSGLNKTLTAASVFTSSDNAVTSNVYGTRFDTTRNAFVIGETVTDANTFLVVKFSDNINTASLPTVGGDLPAGVAAATYTNAVTSEVYLVISHTALTSGSSYNVSVSGLKQTVSGVTYDIDTVSFSVYRN